MPLKDLNLLLSAVGLNNFCVLSSESDKMDVHLYANVEMISRIAAITCRTSFTRH